jgi:hypothetical protein
MLSQVEQSNMASARQRLPLTTDTLKGQLTTIIAAWLTATFVFALILVTFAP